MTTRPFRFRHGDLVQVAKDLGPCMKHFTSDCRAIVLYSYASRYGGDNHDSLGLYLEGEGPCAWYNANQLTLISRNQGDLHEEWEHAAEVERTKKADIKWIFANWKKLKGSIPSASIETLASHVGSGDLWGSRGEGMSFYLNSLKVIDYCKRWLDSGDLEGFLAAHPKFKS